MKNRQQFYALIILSVLVFTSYKNKASKYPNCSLQEDKNELFIANAQDCDGYYPLSEGISFELTYYDKKDKPSAIYKHRIVDAKNVANGVEVTCEMSLSDEKGNSGFEMTYDAKCQNGEYYLNLESMFSQLTSQYKAQGMKISVDNGISVIPNNLTVGDKLEDVTMSMKMSSDAFSMDMTITIFDRNITGKETKTTPAGTFDCIILSQKTTTKVGEVMTVATSSKEWLSKGVGSVRSENYDKKGKLEGYTLLTKFSK